ncbi:MAG: hypothetical protein LBG52_02270 [Candidatus Peribacteria bacterium]|jgi:hypothetical protein|nr:hypothetical protein [Candidatus Peribacteria bacterium]
MIYGLIAFFFGIVVCNLQPESNQYFQSQFLEPNIKSAQLVYLFYDAGGHEYHIFDAQGEHGVPQSWEYLFEGVDVVTGNDEPAPEIQIPVSEDLPSVTGHQPSFSSGTASTLPEPSDPELENTGLPLASVFPYAEKGSLVGLSLSVGNGSSL